MNISPEGRDSIIKMFLKPGYRGEGDARWKLAQGSLSRALGRTTLLKDCQRDWEHEGDGMLRGVAQFMDLVWTFESDTQRYGEIADLLEEQDADERYGFALALTEFLVKLNRFGALTKLLERVNAR